MLLVRHMKTKYLKNWQKEFEKYVYQEPDDKYVYTKIHKEELERDLFETRLKKTSMEYVVRMMIWYGVTNPNLVRDVLEILDIEVNKAQ
jgi:hypothetical protein